MSNVNFKVHLSAVYKNRAFQDKTRINSFPPGFDYELGNADLCVCFFFSLSLL